MALRAGYKGFKKLISPLILNRPGTIGIDGDALNEQLNRVFVPRSEQVVLGAKNQLNTYAEMLKRINTDGTWLGDTYTLNGISFTVANDGKITVNGQANSLIYFNLDTNFDTTKYAGWILSGLPGVGGTSTFVYRVSASISDRTGIQDIGAIDGSIINDNGSGKCLAIRLAQNYNPNNIVFAPMVSIDGGTYAHYAETNAELTADVTTLKGSADDQKTAINAIIAAATDAADFAAFKTAMGAITPVTRSAAPAATRKVTEEVIEEPVTIKKTTRKKSTATADTEKEGE